MVVCIRFLCVCIILKIGIGTDMTVSTHTKWETRYGVCAAMSAPMLIYVRSSFRHAMLLCHVLVAVSTMWNSRFSGRFWRATFFEFLGIHGKFQHYAICAPPVFRIIDILYYRCCYSSAIDNVVEPTLPQHVRDTP